MLVNLLSLTPVALLAAAIVAVQVRADRARSRDRNARYAARLRWVADVTEAALRRNEAVRERVRGRAPALHIVERRGFSALPKGGS